MQVAVAGVDGRGVVHGPDVVGILRYGNVVRYGDVGAQGETHVNFAETLRVEAHDRQVVPAGVVAHHHVLRFEDLDARSAVIVAEVIFDQRRAGKFTVSAAVLGIIEIIQNDAVAVRRLVGAYVSIYEGDVHFVLKRNVVADDHMVAVVLVELLRLVDADTGTVKRALLGIVAGHAVLQREVVTALKGEAVTAEVVGVTVLDRYVVTTKSREAASVGELLRTGVGDLDFDAVHRHVVGVLDGKGLVLRGGGDLGAPLVLRPDEGGLAGRAAAEVDAYFVIGEIGAVQQDHFIPAAHGVEGGLQVEWVATGTG